MVLERRRRLASQLKGRTAWNGHVSALEHNTNGNGTPAVVGRFWETTRRVHWAHYKRRRRHHFENWSTPRNRLSNEPPRMNASSNSPWSKVLTCWNKRSNKSAESPTSSPTENEATSERSHARPLTEAPTVTRVPTNPPTDFTVGGKG